MIPKMIQYLLSRDRRRNKNELDIYMKKRSKDLLERQRTSKIDNSIIDLKLKMIRGSKKKIRKKSYVEKQFNIYESTSESDEMDQIPYMKKPLNKHSQSVLVSTPKVLKSSFEGLF